MSGLDKTELFAKNIRFLRRIVGLFNRKKPLSQDEFSADLGVTRRTVIFWESGKIPQKNKLESLSKYFSKKLDIKVTPEMLLSVDLTKSIEYYPSPKFAGEMSMDERKILDSLFLSAKKLSIEDLKKVVDFVSRLRERKTKAE